MLRYLSSGESHGKAMTAIIEGLPSNLTIEESIINKELQNRQKGYGRGGRMEIEKDSVKIISGTRNNKTIGSPLTLMIENLDWKNWQNKVIEPVTKPRPGHGDLSGSLKYNHTDVRNILERASARETSIRTAVGAIAKILISEFNISSIGHVVAIGGINQKIEITDQILKESLHNINNSSLRCIDKNTEIKMIERIDQSKSNGDSLGGEFEVRIFNAPPGLGSHVYWDRKLDSKIAAEIMSLQGIKSVEIGLGKKSAEKEGSKVHDEIFYSKEKGYYRSTNNAGGIEAGISNGETIIVKASMKPIPTLYKPLRSVDMNTKEPFEASIERSDCCAVPSASVVGQAICSWVIAGAIVEKFGGDSIEEMKDNYKRYKSYLSAR